MRNDFCTGYLAHGKEWSKHKYVAKVKLSNNKYFYFYSMSQYQAYLNRKAKAQKSDAPKEAAVSLGGEKQTAKDDAREAKRQALIERVKNTKGTSSSKKGSGSKTGKTDSTKKSKAGSSKSSSGKKEKASAAKKSSASKASTKKEKEEKTKAKTTQINADNVKVTPTLNTYKYKYGLKDSDISSYKADDDSSDRISEAKVKDIIQDMVEKYPDNSSGYLLSGFTNNINYNFKWVKEGGTIKLLDPDTDKEIPIGTALLNTNSVQLFRTDNKKKLY